MCVPPPLSTFGVPPHSFEKGNYKRTTHPKKEKQTAISPYVFKALALSKEKVTRVPIFLFPNPKFFKRGTYIVLTSEKEDRSGQDSTDISEARVVCHTHKIFDQVHFFGQTHNLRIPFGCPKKVSLREKKKKYRFSL